LPTLGGVTSVVPPIVDAAKVSVNAGVLTSAGRNASNLVRAQK
jgi:hypothetical protein